MQPAVQGRQGDHPGFAVVEARVLEDDDLRPVEVGRSIEGQAAFSAVLRASFGS
jgi:hypothetical protein